MKKVLVFGGSGLVGSKFIELNSKTLALNAPDAAEVDILNKEQVVQAVAKVNPDFVINLAAFTDVEGAESQKGDENGICFKLNAVGAKNVAQACAKFKKKLIHISTEYIFDGTKETSPYVEEDQPNPINWYGQTKYFGEQFVLENITDPIIVRLCMPFSPFYQLKKDIARFFLEQLKMGNKITAVDDQRITPTLVDDIANALKVLVLSDTSGFYHISSTDSVTPLEFAKTIAETFQLDYSQISPISLEEYNQNKKAKLLKYSWLNPAKFEAEFGEGILHTVEQGLIIFKKEVDVKAVDQI